MNNFPQPFRIGGATRWGPEDISQFEQQQGITLPPLAGLVTVRDLAARYRVSVPTIWRWAQLSKDGGRGAA